MYAAIPVNNIVFSPGIPGTGAGSKAMDARFDEANDHHSANQAADKWYREFLCEQDYKSSSGSRRQMAAFIKRTGRVCDACGHHIRCNKTKTKPFVIFAGGWPLAHTFVFHDEECTVRVYARPVLFTCSCRTMTETGEIHGGDAAVCV